MRKFPRGFILIEAMVVLAFSLVIGVLVVTIFSNLLFNRPGQTEARATQAAQQYMDKTKIAVARLNCAYDSDGDGYGSCTVVTKASEGVPSEKIYLQCPARFVNTLMGATSCKEVEFTMQMNNKVSRHR